MLEEQLWCRGDFSPLLVYANFFYVTTACIERKHSTVAIGKPERQVRKASHCGSKRQ